MCLVGLVVRNSTAKETLWHTHCVSTELDRLSSWDEDDIVPSDEEAGHNAWNLFLDAVPQHSPGMLVDKFP